MSALVTTLPAGTQRRWLGAGWRFLPVVIVVLIWQLTVDLDLVDRAFLPPVNAVAAALWDMTRNGELALNLAISVYRAFAGLAIGSILGIAIGLAMATSQQADRFFGPLVATTYSLPKTSLIPLFILWFGIGDVTDIVSVVLACLLPVIVSTYHGVKAVPALLVWSARAIGNAASSRAVARAASRRARFYLHRDPHRARFLLRADDLGGNDRGQDRGGQAHLSLRREWRLRLHVWRHPCCRRYRLPR
jgi:ABC-type proline/glycine betaine transport system permease subunit